MIEISNQQEFEAAAERLSNLIGTNPAQAILESRQIGGVGKFTLPVVGLCAGILVDGGSAHKDSGAVQEGVNLFRELLRDLKNRLDYRYNLANGLSALAHLSIRPLADWYITTREERREARALLHSVIQNSKNANLSAQAGVNLGNQLDAGYRWVEAYDFWVDALRNDPSNCVGALATAQMLIRRIAEQRPHPKALHAVAGYYARLAALNTSRIEALAGRQAAQLVSSLPTFDSTWQPPKTNDIKDEYLRFVASNRLALVGTVEGLDSTEERWDQLHILSIYESPESGSGVPAVFAMMKQLKADFCAARWLAYISQTQVPPETSIYGDTLDYATYGIKPSLLALAQRAALDILDRVAACTNDYLAIGKDPQRISFRTFWREKSGDWSPYLADELTNRNPGIVALGELASDLVTGGYLESQTHLRNTGTHRFCVLHDLGKSPSRPSPAVEHYHLREFLNETITSLRVARSAIIYLADAIAWREKCRAAATGATGTLNVPFHHHIRGED